MVSNRSRYMVDVCRRQKQDDRPDWWDNLCSRPVSSIIDEELPMPVKKRLVFEDNRNIHDEGNCIDHKALVNTEELSSFVASDEEISAPPVPPVVPLIQRKTNEVGTTAYDDSEYTDRRPSEYYFPTDPDSPSSPSNMSRSAVDNPDSRMTSYANVTSSPSVASSKRKRKNEPILSAPPVSPVVPLIQWNTTEVGTIADDDDSEYMDRRISECYSPSNPDSPSSSSSLSCSIVDNPAPRTASEVKVTSIALCKRKRKNLGPEVLTKKRTVNRARWQSTAAKEARNSGQAYIDPDGNQIVKRRTMAPGCNENCRFKCTENISFDQRLKHFETFWKLKDRTRQWDFIIRLTKVSMPKERTTNWKSRRNNSRAYHFVGEEGNEIRVCLKTFVETLGISEQWVRTAVEKMDQASPDKRGIHTANRKTIKPAVKDGVRAHINAFPRIPSHYCRKDTKKEYLEQGLNVRKMHQLYLEYAREQKFVEIATERQYRDLFNTEFNISFHVPKKDQCDTCTRWTSATEEEKKNIEETYLSHQKNKDSVRKIKDDDKEAAKVDSTICVACFDLQKVLVLPYGETSAFYYKRKLSVYNFTIFDIGKREGHCYVWDESLGKRGSDEISTFLVDFIKKKSDNGVKDFRLYSDNCAGQNKNRYVYAALLIASIKCHVKITFRFLEVGHTQSEGDSMHALIERRAKGRELFIPEQWYNVIRFAKTSNPYIVNEIEQEQIHSVKNIVRSQNWEKDIDGNVVSWMNIREIYFDEASPSEVKFKYNFDADYKTMSIHRARGRPCDLNNIVLEKAYSEKIPIPTKKVEDLLNLCGKGLIPTRYHNFYNSLIRGGVDEDNV